MSEIDNFHSVRSKLTFVTFPFGGALPIRPHEHFVEAIVFPSTQLIFVRLRYYFVYLSDSGNDFAALRKRNHGRFMFFPLNQLVGGNADD